MEKENIETLEQEAKKEQKQQDIKQDKKHKKNKHLEELEIKVKTLEEDALRAKADLINYRKRKDEEVSNLLKYANADILLSFLPVLDNFERVINQENLSEELTKYLEGFKLIYNQIKDILSANEVKEIEALDKEFDPMYHQSISVRKDETKESGVVLEVYQKGYTYKDKVLRPAMVIINE